MSARDYQSGRPTGVNGASCVGLLPAISTRRRGRLCSGAARALRCQQPKQTSYRTARTQPFAPRTLRSVNSVAALSLTPHVCPGRDCLRQVLRDRKIVHQLPRRRLQTGSKLHDVLYPRAALSAFDLPKVGPVDSASMRGGFLAPAEFGAAGTHPCSERRSGRIERGLAWTGHVGPSTYVPRVLIQSVIVLCTSIPCANVL